MFPWYLFPPTNMDGQPEHVSQNYAGEPNSFYVHVVLYIYIYIYIYPKFQSLLKLNPQGQ